MKTIKDLQEMQSWSLEMKVFHTIEVVQTFISKMAENGGGNFTSQNCFVSFSGGVDSLVLLYICRRFIDKDFPAVFCQTGQEWNEISKFVKTFDNVEIIRPKYTVQQIVEKYGFPLVSKEVSEYVYEARNAKIGSKLREKRLGNGAFSIPQKWRWLVDAKFQICHLCCHYLKKEPFHRYEKETGRKPLIGITAQESNLRTTEWAKRGGCNAFSGRIASYPLSIWTSKDVWDFIKQNDIEYCSIYDKLVRKQTGCVMCGFGAHLENSRLKALLQTHPKRYTWMMNLQNNGISYRQALRSVGVELPDEYPDLFND